MAGFCLFRAYYASRFIKVSLLWIISLLRKIKSFLVFEISLMKVDSDIDVEEDLSFAGLSRNYILIKP